MIVDIQNVKKVYINLKTDTARNDKFISSMKTLNYTNYQRFDAIRLPKQRGCFNVGCSTSHNVAMKENVNSVPFVLFEDDAGPTNWYNNYVINGKLTIPEDSDAVYLGYSMAGHKEWFKAHSIDDKWMQVTSCMATHAILFVTERGLRAFIENSDKTIMDKKPLDIGYASGVLPNIKVYAPKQAIFYQTNGCVITTNVNVNLEGNVWKTFNHDNSLNFERQIW
jgi:hypothetical protein